MPPTDADGDRAQLILVGAVAIAIILMGLVVVFNTVLYTDAKGSTDTLDEANQAQAFADQVSEEIGRIASGLAASDRDLNGSSLASEIRNWSEIQAISHAHTGPVLVGIEPNSSSCSPSPCTLLSTYRATVTWEADGFSYQHTVTAPLSPFARSVVYANGSVLHTASDRGITGEFSNANDVSTAGPMNASLDGDEGIEIAYVKNNNDVLIVNADNGTTEVLVDASSVSHTPKADDTSLAVGKWNGGVTSVLYADESSDGIWLVNATNPNSPVEVASDGDGTDGVVGIGDVNGDGNDEIVYVDGSQELKYYEGGTSTFISSVGQNVGIGTGRLVDLNDNGVSEVAFVDTNQDIVVTSAAGGEPSFTIGLGNAAKAPIAPIDVDGDGKTEIVYRAGSGELKYVDDIRGSQTVKDFGPRPIKPDGGATQ